jgi:uncharacterized RDD family membrane protein YckC
MSEQRNPYATTRVPLDVRTDSGAVLSDYVDYGGFWIRLGAALLDGLILLPLSVFAFVGVAFSRLFYFYYFVPGLLFMAFYYVYLVMANGGTPGKRILRMRIAMEDGSPVMPQAAILRNIVELGFRALAMLALALAGLAITDTEYQPLGFIEKTLFLQGRAPAWNRYVLFGSFAWGAISAIVILCNDKRRTLHDFLAGTVVIRADRP